MVPMNSDELILSAISNPHADQIRLAVSTELGLQNGLKALFFFVLKATHTATSLSLQLYAHCYRTAYLGLS
jgi:hypothetical protein